MSSRTPPACPQFPLATFLCGTGYMMTLVADKVVASATGHSHGGCAGHGGGGGGGGGLPRGGPAADSCCAVEVLAGALHAAWARVGLAWCGAPLRRALVPRAAAAPRESNHSAGCW